MFWLNGYECSVCGIELPPSFVEERREHFDFHLAERLQEEEESGHTNRILKPRQRSFDSIYLYFSNSSLDVHETCLNCGRLIEKDQISQSRKRKKLKASPSEGKHIPIHAFFTKSTQNF